MADQKQTPQTVPQNQLPQPQSLRDQTFPPEEDRVMTLEEVMEVHRRQLEKDPELRARIAALPPLVEENYGR